MKKNDKKSLESLINIFGIWFYMFWGISYCQETLRNQWTLFWISHLENCWGIWNSFRISQMISWVKKIYHISGGLPHSTWDIAIVRRRPPSYEVWYPHDIRESFMGLARLSTLCTYMSWSIIQPYKFCMVSSLCWWYCVHVSSFLFIILNSDTPVFIRTCEMRTPFTFTRKPNLSLYYISL